MSDDDSNNNNNNNKKCVQQTAERLSCVKGGDHEDKSKPISTFQSRMNVLKSRRTGREAVQNGGKKRSRQREDWDRAEAEKLSFTLVNKQGGWGESRVPSNNISA